MNDIIPTPNRGTTEAQCNEDITPGWFTQSIDECPSAIKAHATDMAFTITRSSQEPVPSWTFFNQNASMVNPEQISVGYLPIIQTPANDIATLNTSQASAARSSINGTGTCTDCLVHNLLPCPR